ncbi:MAG: hypothetical protein AAF546_12115 [Verrucomicrobiota bacterium]
MSETIRGSFSWCVDSHSFDVEKRSYSISVADNPDYFQFRRVVSWKGIKEFELKEVDEDEIDPECMPVLIGIHQAKENESYRTVIQTDIHTILIHSEHPYETQDTPR